MTETKNIHSLGYYDDFIQTNFILNHCGIELTKIGRKIADTVLKVNLKTPLFPDDSLLRTEAKTFVDFIHKQHKHPDERPLWYKINVVDQAVNDYVGIGHLNLESDWVKFIITYLDVDRAEQGGDTMERSFTKKHLERPT